MFPRSYSYLILLNSYLSSRVRFLSTFFTITLSLLSLTFKTKLLHQSCNSNHQHINPPITYVFLECSSSPLSLDIWHFNHTFCVRSYLLNNKFGGGVHMSRNLFIMHRPILPCFSTIVILLQLLIFLITCLCHNSLFTLDRSP